MLKYYRALDEVADWLGDKGVTLPDAIKRRDRLEPGRQRKELVEDKLTAAFMRRFRMQRRRIAEALDRILPTRKALGPDEWIAQIPQDVYADIKTEAYILQLLIAATEDGIDLFAANIAIGIDWTMANTQAAAWATKYTSKLLRGLDETTAKALRQALRSFAEQPGFTIGDVVKILPFGEERALRIAITEITNVYAEAEQLAGLELKKQFPDVRVVKTWFTNNDPPIVCPICFPLHGQVVEIEQEFYSDVLGRNIERPAAHTGCVLPGNQILAAGKIVAGAQSFYNGWCIELTFDGGRKLSITPNHPILTLGGWVAANELHEGMNCLGALDGQREFCIVNPYKDQVEAAIEDVFAALEMSDFMSPTSVPAAAEDFHGDGEFVEGKIKIVRPNGFLRSSANPHIVQETNQGFFMRTDFGLHPLQGLGALNHFVDGGFPSERSSVGSGHLVAALACGHSVPLDRLRFGLISGLDPGSKQPLPHRPTIDANFISEFVFRFASDIAMYEIVEIRNFNYSGHVYDLQVEPHGFYFASGIITHNCRCWLSSRTDIGGEL